MQTKAMKTVCVLLAVLFAMVALTSCDFSLDSLTKQNEGPEPVAVTLKTDLKDAMFTFTYGELKEVLPADLLANLFEDFEEKDDSTTIELNYNEIKARYSGNKDENLFANVLALLDDSERAALETNRAEVLAYYNRIANAVKAQRPQTEYNEDFWVADDSIAFTDQNGTVSNEDSAIAKSARLYKDFILEGVKDALPHGKTDANASLDDILYLKGSSVVSELTLADIDALYSSVTATTEKNSADEKVVTELTRTVEIHLKNENAAIRKAYSFREPADVLAKLNRPENSFTVNSAEFEPFDCVITAVFNAATDELISLSYDKNTKVTASLTGEGSLASLGTQTLNFNCGGNMYYHFGWESEAE